MEVIEGSNVWALQCLIDGKEVAHPRIRKREGIISLRLACLQMLLAETPTNSLCLNTGAKFKLQRFLDLREGWTIYDSK